MKGHLGMSLWPQGWVLHKSSWEENMSNQDDADTGLFSLILRPIEQSRLKRWASECKPDIHPVVTSHWVVFAEAGAKLCAVITREKREMWTHKWLVKLQESLKQLLFWCPKVNYWMICWSKVLVNQWISDHQQGARASWCRREHSKVNLGTAWNTSMKLNVPLVPSGIPSENDACSTTHTMPCQRHSRLQAKRWINQAFIDLSDAHLPTRCCAPTLDSQRCFHDWWCIQHLAGVHTTPCWSAYNTLLVIRDPRPLEALDHMVWPGIWVKGKVLYAPASHWTMPGPVPGKQTKGDIQGLPIDWSARWTFDSKCRQSAPGVDCTATSDPPTKGHFIRESLMKWPWRSR